MRSYSTCFRCTGNISITAAPGGRNISFIKPAPCMVTNTPVRAISRTCSSKVSSPLITTYSGSSKPYFAMIAFMSSMFTKWRELKRLRSRMVTCGGGLGINGSVMLSDSYVMRLNSCALIISGKPKHLRQVAQRY